MQFDSETLELIGTDGSLSVPEGDEVTRKLAMLIEGECEGLGPKKAAIKYGYSEQRYFQIRNTYVEQGATGLTPKKRGPKTNYRRTDEVERQVIRLRFLDPDANSEVISQKLNQQGLTVSDRSVRRIIEKFGLQKKTL
jgi:transposase